MRESWTAPELAYFAGILDGEGSITLRASKKHKRGEMVCGVAVGNTSLDLLLWIKERFGGVVALEQRHNIRHKPVWRWVASAKDLTSILTAVLPYLVIKRDRAELMISYRQTFFGLKGRERDRDAHGWIRPGRMMPTEVIEERESIREQLVALNKRGA